MYNNEMIEDLQYKGYKIIQKKDSFKFGVDAVLAAHFSEQYIKKDHKILDLGTGTGIIAILVAARTPAAEIAGIEIQADMADMAERSVKLNDLNGRIAIINDDFRTSEHLNSNYFDHVITNPPYKKSQSGIINPDSPKAISRHEITCTLEDIIKVSSKVLKQYGIFTMVNRPERLCDSMELMRKYKIEPKSIRFVHPYTDSPPNMMLIRGVKNGNPFLKAESPLYVFKDKNVYSDEIDRIYSRD